MADMDICPSTMGPIFWVWIAPILVVPKWPSAIGPQLLCSGAVVWYAICLDSYNWALWLKYHGRHWYQSFIDGSNIWSVDRTDTWGPGMDHPPLERSYLVEAPSYDMSGALIFLTGFYVWDFISDIDTNPSSMAPISGVCMGPPLVFRNASSAIGLQLSGSKVAALCVMRLVSLNCALWVRFHGWYWYHSFIDGSDIWGVDKTEHWGSDMNHLQFGRSYLVVDPSYDMFCALIL